MISNPHPNPETQRILLFPFSRRENQPLARFNNSPKGITRRRQKQNSAEIKPGSCPVRDGNPKSRVTVVAVIVSPFSSFPSAVGV